MTLSLPPLIAWAALCATLQEPEASPQTPSLALQVNVAIADGVDHLRALQGSDSLWRGDERRFPGGLTAFVGYTLIKSGVSRRDAQVRRAVRALADIPATSTYGTSARLLFYQALGEPDVWRPRAQESLDFLLEHQEQGLWGYPEEPLDLSNVQFALLGLRSARDLGLEVPEAALVACARALWDLQDERTGGFRYREGLEATGGMTAATLGNLALLDDFAEHHRGLRSALKGRSKSRARAHEYLVERWNPARNPWGPGAWTPGFGYAYLWAVERYAELTDQVTLGEANWYRDGAEYLLDVQNEAGGWGTEVHSTCFALLFLRRTTFSGGGELEPVDRAQARPRAPKKPPVKLSADAAWVTDWLVAGPFVDRRGKQSLDRPPFQPAGLKPREGRKVAGQAWERMALHPSRWTDLDELSGRPAEDALWLLATELGVGGEAATEALLWLTVEDGWRVFLDGEEISSGRRVQAPLRPDVQVPLTLEPGEHRLVVLLEDALGVAAIAARLSDAHGRPTTAVRAGLGDGR